MNRGIVPKCVIKEYSVPAVSRIAVQDDIGL